MARTPRWMQGGFRSYKDVTRRKYNPANQQSKEAFVARLWSEMTPVARWLDTLRGQSERPNGGNRVHYERSSLLMMFVTALALNMSVADAYSFVQGSRRLRKLAGFSEPTEETLIQLAGSVYADDVREDGFPCRQTVESFFDWLDRWAGADAIDETTGELSREVCLEPLQHLTYSELPVRMAKKFGISMSKVAVDSTRIKSPRRRNSGKRPDKGADYMRRKEEKAMLGRLKVSTVLVEVPIVVYSQITTDSEITHLRAKTIDSLAERSNVMKDIAAAQGMPSFAALDRALIVGDNGFLDNATMQKVHSRKFFGAFRIERQLTREVVGTRAVRRTSDGRESILDVCNDGVHFCTCDAKRHPHERRPMLQTAGDPFGTDPYVHVQCENPICPSYAVRWYVPFRGADKVFASGRRELGDVNHALVNPIWRALKDVEVSIFKGCQAIEHYHSQLLEKLGLGIKDTTGRRKFSGDLRHHFYYALGDLIWNLIIFFNLQDGRALERLDRETLWDSAQRTARRIEARRVKTHAELVEENEDDANADAETTKEPKKKQKKKKKEPTFAQFFWRHESAAQQS